ncbi:MAG: sugar transferase, partial [Staphylococcus equorum]|nr:sugar transferase [Staphylococcus equorum]
MKSNTFYNIYIKRLLDIIISGVALLLLSPLFLIIYILVKVKLGSPTFFKQRRPGLNEKIFE